MYCCAAIWSPPLGHACHVEMYDCINAPFLEPTVRVHDTSRSCGALVGELLQSAPLYGRIEESHAVVAHKVSLMCANEPARIGTSLQPL